MLLESFADQRRDAPSRPRESVTAERHRQRLAAAEAERQRWARELHDDTLQSLQRLRIGLSAATALRRTQAMSTRRSSARSSSSRRRSPTCGR